MSTCLKGQNDAYFYHGLPYGSQKNFNPFMTIINGGFGIMQIDNRSTKINSIDYGMGCHNVWMNITHPIKEIKGFGALDFIKSELIPNSFQTSGAQWFPNYQQHLIGGGMTYRSFIEWFRFHRIKYPRLNALFSITAYHYLNEVVENSSYRGPNMDPIADLLIFDPFSLILFSYDPVARFFGQTLHMRDWSFQPVITPKGTIENVGQNFNIKIDIPKMDKWSLFYCFGVHGTLGLSYTRSDGQSFSVGGGLVAKDLVEVDTEAQANVKTTKLRWTTGIFYDRNNSLLASLILSGTKGYKMRLNIYPGLFSIGNLSPGFFCALGKHEEFIFGAHLHFIPVGFGTSFK